MYDTAPASWPQPPRYSQMLTVETIEYDDNGRIVKRTVETRSSGDRPSADPLRWGV
jgi:hypothetical protein